MTNTGPSSSRSVPIYRLSKTKSEAAIRSIASCSRNLNHLASNRRQPPTRQRSRGESHSTSSACHRTRISSTGLPVFNEGSGNPTDAVDELAEQLLRSPHFGERWGRWWLDAARYSDSSGYEKDLQRRVWFYRDWSSTR